MEKDKLDVGVKLHLQEADVLKKQWVKYVYKTIDDLSTKLDATNEKLYQEREYLLTSLTTLKDGLQEELKTSDANTSKELKIIEKKITEFIKKTETKFSKVNFNITNEVKDVNEELTSTNTTLTEVRTKVGIYSAITSLIITALTTAAAGGLVYLFQESIKTWLKG